VQQAVGDAHEVTGVTLSSQVGSGALPVDRLPSYGLAVRPVKGKRGSLERLDASWRALPRPVIGRIAEKTLWLDLRCLEQPDEAALAAQWRERQP
jgi:L-seryl-tRNA(Ser) seleniumtransferase